ncbi:MAG: sigma-54-dependent Fis family transcriptional regulator [Bacteroidetes bacterium]|nr:sigma-54-dependent Fis family transcriptional regulator [Bacteroidota bacterium]
MAFEKHAVLCVDDEPAILQVLIKLLETRYVVYSALSGFDALNILNDHSIAIALVDQKMPHMTGVELLGRIKDSHPHIVRIILTAYTDVEDLVNSINVGEIFRYIHKPWDADTLFGVLEEAVIRYEVSISERARQIEIEKLASEKARLEQEIVLLKSEIEKEFSIDNIVSASPQMNEVRRLIKTAATSDETVLIHGESGTGKELVAKAIHYNSKRNKKKFLALDCGALSENLLESELFGHRRGSFTGAIQDKKGLIEDADGGTIFLDEISNTSTSFQAKLLRVIQEREIRRIGDTESRPVDVRILAATNKDLYEETQKGGFRSDLYYRLNVLNITLPPLRERRSDIPLLVNHFINEHNQKFNKNIVSISRDALNRLSVQSWNGNVRELRNMVSRMIIMAEDDHLTVKDLPDEIQSPGGYDLPSPENSLMDQMFSVSGSLTLEDLERRYILHVLKRTGQNKADAAKLLGMKRTTLVMRMKKLGI